MNNLNVFCNTFYLTLNNVKRIDNLDNNKFKTNDFSL